MTTPSLIQNPLRWLSALSAAAALATSLFAQQPGTSPVKIYLMIGQSNTEGHGEITPVGTQGTLQYIVANDPGNLYQFLVTPGATDIPMGTTSWVTRDDVWIHYERENGGLRKGDLVPGYGASSANTTIGPELGFGHNMGDALGNQALLIKASWGGRSLGNDFLSPSSGANIAVARQWGDPGFYYKETLRLVEQATTNLSAYFPNYNGQGYQIAGICWHQGYNDRVTPEYSAVYEVNLANFIRDIRSKEHGLGVPGLPFVIATTGMGGGSTYTEVEDAQFAMLDPAKSKTNTTYADFVGSVAVIDTRNGTYNGVPYWQPVANSPADQNYHWNRNAKSYLHIGLAMGDQMPLLTSPVTPSRLLARGGPGGITLTWQNGTETPTNVRILRDGVEIAASTPVFPTTFLDSTALPGVHNYQVEFTMPTTPAAPLTVTHDSAISGLSAHRSQTGVTLVWTNSITYSGIQIQRNGSIIEAALSGTATSYVDTAAPSTGTVTYTVVPTNGTSTPAETTINLGPHTSPGALIYEPFDIAAASSLHNVAPSGFGLSGNWNRNSGSTANELQLTAAGTTYGTLPVAGNRLKNNATGGGRANNISIGTTLSTAGLLSDGATLWFSLLVTPVVEANSTSGFGLANGNATNYNSAVNAVGINVQNGSDLEAWSDTGGTTVNRITAQANMGIGVPHFVVGKLVWGTGGGNDTLEIYLPDENLVQGTRKGAVNSFNFDQTALDRIVLYNSAGGIEFDEIRFGANYNDVIGVGTDTSGDITPPSPATMSFATPPAATSSTAITMTATTATDLNGVQYRFIETTGNPGATSSEWQSSPTYTDTGLNPNTQYTYTVQARDMSVNFNTNTASSPASATTLAPDTNPPPTPGFASGPTATSTSEITMTATNVTDPEGGSVEYLFTETSGNPGGTSSGWQSSTSYTDSGLNPGIQYSYTIKARDSATPPNESAASAPASATTQAGGGAGGALIYEPFAGATGALNGQAAGTGLTGNWTRYQGTAGSNELIVSTPGLTYGTLPVTGNFVQNQSTGGTRCNYASLGTALGNAGLLNDGATLWFSILVEPVTSANTTSSFALASANVTTSSTSGNAVGINLQNGSDLEYWRLIGGTNTRTNSQTDLHNIGGAGLGYRPHLVVGKLVWGSGGANDTMELYMPNTSLVQGTIKGTAQSFQIDQSTLNRVILTNTGGGIKYDEIRFGASYESVIGQGSTGPGPLDHFAISPIASPQTVGTPITDITLTAQDAANATVTSFTGTVTFGGTGGFTGTSAAFTAGVLTGVSVTPTTAGSNLTLTVTDGVSGKSGTTTITTIRTQYAAWSGGAAFDADDNNDGVANGLAFLLGAATPTSPVALPVASQSNGNLILNFIMRNAANRGNAALRVQHSSDTGVAGAWESALVPDEDLTVNDVVFDITSGGPTNAVQATIPVGKAAGGKLFGRLSGEP
jgi:alpha-galactosidase